MTEKNGSEKGSKNKEKFSFFTCIGVFVLISWVEYLTYAIHWGDGFTMNCDGSPICRLSVFIAPIGAPFVVIMAFYTCVLARKAPYTWLLAQLFALYFIFTKA